MAELDLTAAIEAGNVAAKRCYVDRNGFADVADLVEFPDHHYARVYAEAAVRAAAPLIEQAALEAVVARVEATFVTGASPDWLQTGAKPTASVIREWVKRTIRGDTDGS